MSAKLTWLAPKEHTSDMEQSPVLCWRVDVLWFTHRLVCLWLREECCTYPCISCMVEECKTAETSFGQAFLLQSITDRKHEGRRMSMDRNTAYSLVQ